MILIGSQALKHWFPDFTREPHDTDYIGEGTNIPGKVEYHKNTVFDNYIHSIMLPEDLLTLKMSHLFWDIKWNKHMYDVQFLLKKGIKPNIDLFYKLYNYWCDLHGAPLKSNLNMNKADFFNNALKTYDHDHLHILLNPSPIYMKILEDGEEVLVSEVKFNQLTYEEKLELVREEVYVMAFERLGGRDYRVAYSWMLKKFIIHHAPMWEALFIIENYIPLHLPVYNYKEVLEKKLLEEKLKDKSCNENILFK